MDPATALALASGATQMLRLLIPEIEKLAKAGKIPKEAQQKVWDELNGLRDPASYTGSEFTPSGR